MIALADAAVQLVNLAEEAWGSVNDLLPSGKRQNNLVVGNREAGDTLLYKEKRRPDRLFGCGSHVYQRSGDNTITAVVVKDNWNDDTGSNPEIISGGPDHKHVKVKVTPRFGRGFNHNVYVYGKKKN